METPLPSSPAPGIKTCPRCGFATESWASICPQCTYEWISPEQQIEAEPMTAFDSVLTMDGKPPRVVFILIAMNILVFLVMVLNGVNFVSPEAGVLYRWGANFPPATVHGQGWRLLTSTFLHFGVIHLAVNMWALWAGGPRMERVLGHAGFSVTYFLSGLAGSVATLTFHPLAVGAGASGAIFGVFGAMAGVLLRDRKSIPHPVFMAVGKSILIFLGINLVYGLKPGIDLSAHFGGFAAGILCGAILAKRVGEAEPASRFRLPGLTMAVGLALIGSLAAGVAHLNRKDLSVPFERVEFAAVEDAMKKILQEHFESKKDLQGIAVKTVTILHREGNEYSGTVVLSRIDREFSLSIRLTIEGTKVSWTLQDVSTGKKPT